MNKNIKILLAVFAVLITVYFLFFRTGEKVSTEKIDAKLFVADSSKIDKIEIVKNSETILLEKVNNQWKLTKPVEYPADTTNVYLLLRDLKNFKLESVASENPVKFSSYLDSVNNAKVSTYQEGVLLGTFILGKSQANDNSYIKKPEENRILLASNLTASLFTRSAKDFRNKFILSIMPYSVNSVSFKSTDSNNVDFSVTKDTAGKWNISGDSVSFSVMEGFLNLLANFNTDDFIDSVITDLPVPTFTVTVNAAGQPTVINLYKEKSSDPNAAPSYITQISGNKQLFRLFGALASQLMKKRTDFIPPKQN
ncbi:MAG: hypothetical protein UZ05_CHB002001146 [Chlorobi bacterium OLB5]|nr:MAG: hypothetical protein UZ05_CHB002001146 [Chlorobi bacterium OLB5]